MSIPYRIAKKGTYMKFLTIATLILVGVIILSACGMSDNSTDKTVHESNNISNESDNISDESDKISVVTTIFPFYDMVRAIGDGNADATMLIPVGSEPHSYEPKPSDIITITNADIFMYVGPELEPWADDILEGVDTSGMNIIEADLLVELIPLSDGNFDPHIWLDFQNDISIAQELIDSLSEADPVNADEYKKNGEKYLSKLKSLDEQYEYYLSTCGSDTIITGGHNAYKYMAKRYGFNVVSAYGVAPDSEPTPRQIAEISDMVKKYNMEYIVFEELVDPKISEALAEEAGIWTVAMHPAGNVTSNQFTNGTTFFDLMEDNLDTLTMIMKCDEE